MEARSRNFGFGFPGYDGCFPKATRSSRGRGDHTMRKSLEASDLPKEMCFFELLATVAGQLLQEQDGEALASRSLVDLKAPKMSASSVLASGMRSCHAKGSETAIKAKEEEATEASKDLRNRSDKCYEPSGANFCLHDNSDPLHGKNVDVKPLEEPIKAYSSRKRKPSGSMSCQGSAVVSSINWHTKTQPIAPRSDQCTSKGKGDCHEDAIPGHSVDKKETISWNKQEGVVDQLCIPQCQEIDLLAPFQDIESPLLVSSGSSEETPFSLEPKSYSTVAFENGQGEVREEISSWKVGDDDDNSSESTVPKSLLTKSSSMSYNRAMKARRCTNSTVRRRGLGVGSKRKCHEMEDGERSQNEKSRSGKVKNKMCKLPFPKDDNEQSHNLPMGILVDDDGSPIHCEREKSSSVMSSPITASPTKQDDTNVKLSIKSFLVPELMVALPESATVANLKKAVMDAAMSLLGGGLCVRVLLQGKKVTDETESLLEAGISDGGKLDSLGFMLEPNPFPASAGVDDTFLVLSHNANQTSSRYPVVSKGSEINTGSYHVGPSEGLLEIDANSSGTEMQSTTVSPSKEDGLVHESNGLVIPGSCALVRHSGQANNSPNGLAVVPFGPSAGSIGINKRRIRRPFSVSEVEVLVQAVEKLGTGRWRDVKLHAFPQAKHRTYVDLKDKWKTLVHTASIAPHQRRGEPVPQGLLDRVIQAHSYWTAQQAKQQSMETKDSWIVSLLTTILTTVINWRHLPGMEGQQKQSIRDRATSKSRKRWETEDSIVSAKRVAL
ncbi:hypothetical protein GOP47_0006437 [Adiantum capillus-veneris]|uniref:Uncharacterized protein n=1 Tax=Adiantum capillus-veneris TaxID=13818 RepID=A0A9D4V2V9_ADICA|nr:hypothetical protein GOP47_0006437 [Adiantum capillus-veneris]